MGKKDLYESFEMRFKKNNDLHMKLYKFLLKEAGVLEKHDYMLQLLYKEYMNNRASK